MMQAYFPDNYTLDDIFNKSLINCLPGTFYIYEILPEEVKMKRWNKFHKDVFGLTDEECLDRHLLSYVDPAYHNIITDAIKKITDFGSVKQVLANVIDKDGESVPFVFEGYKFTLDTKLYFTGVGLNISDLVSVKEQLKILELETERISQEVLKKEKELLALALQDNQQKVLIDTISLKLERILKKKDSCDIKLELNHLKNSLNSQIIVKDNWKPFKELFVNIHKNFFYRLRIKHPTLTKNEIRFCAYLKINMSSNDLCSVLHISKDGLKKKRYRLRKKLDIERGASMETYITSL